MRIPRQRATHAEHAQLREWLDEILIVAREKYGYDRPVPLTTFTKGRVCGRAHYSDGSIDINVDVLRLDAVQAKDTVAHEVAHVVAYWKHGAAGRGHGFHWREVARALGANPAATCSMPALPKARRTRLYVYFVAGQTLHVKARTHKVLQRSPLAYALRKNVPARIYGRDWTRQTVLV